MILKFRRWSPVALSLTLLFALLFRLESVPPLWWDEGWTLLVAHNWVEHGQYARLLEGKIVPAALQAAPLVTASVSLSFRVFGVGVIQARMVGVVFTLACLALMGYLAQRIYDRSVALGTLLVLTILPAYIELFPIYTGRQVLGEMPALCFLLAGYAAILSISRHPVWALSLAVLFWAIALSTKLQAIPFWACSMLVPIFICVYRRDWKSSSSWVIALLGSFVGSRILLALWEHLLQSKTDIAAPITGLYQVTALVGSIPSRMFALIVVVLFGIPTLLGLCYGLRSIKKSGNVPCTSAEQVKAALLFLALSWFAWFSVLSVGWIRYVFPPTFIGSIFVAAMFHDLTHGYNVGYTIQQSTAFFRGRGFNKEGVGALLVLVIVVTAAPRTALALYKTYILDADSSVQETADFFNSQIPPDAMIETYDSELFFLLNRPYHYPPDQIHVKLIRRTFLYDDDVIIDYDPLVANPDYLVVGPHSKQWRLYDSVLSSGAFRLLRSYARYQIYERIR